MNEIPGSSAADPAIEIDGAEKAFGGNSVLRGFSLTVGRGESFALIGGSGVGKSVVMKSVLGLIPLDEGQIRINGKNIRDREGIAYSRIGMLFQEGALFDSMPVWQNVGFRLMRGKGRLASAKAKSMAIEKLERVGLSADVADLYPSELSGGMKKRAGLARAIAADPEIIFFDEPTTGLDPIRASVINELIRGIVRESKATAFTITHDMESVRIVSDRAGLLHDGKIVWLGDSKTLSDSSNPYLRQFVQGASTGPMKVSI